MTFLIVFLVQFQVQRIIKKQLSIHSLFERLFEFLSRELRKVPPGTLVALPCGEAAASCGVGDSDRILGICENDCVDWEIIMSGQTVDVSRKAARLVSKSVWQDALKVVSSLPKPGYSTSSCLLRKRPSRVPENIK